MVERIIGIDPGETTGFVETLVEDDGDLKVLTALEIVWSERTEIIPLIASMVGSNPEVPTLAVLESFNLYPHEFRHQVGSEFPSVRVIGIVEAAQWYVEQQGNHFDIHFQGASCKTRVKVLHKLPASNHIEDAYKHARYLIAKRRNR